LEGQIREGHLRRDTFFGGARSKSGQLIAGPRGRGAGEQRLQIIESMNDAADGMREGHGIAAYLESQFGTSRGVGRA
jgi:hypothetical protein